MGGGSEAGALADAVVSPARWGATASRCVRAAGMVRLCARTAGARTTAIALVDGVLDHSHPSLQRARIEIIDRTRDASATACEHATFLASIFAGAGPQCLGLAPACPILDIGVVDDAMLSGLTSPRASATRLATAIDLVSSHGVRIIQMSLDLTLGMIEARPLIVAVEAAIRRGAVVVVAAGQRPLAPSNPVLLIPGVIAVTGADRTGNPLHSIHRAAALDAGGLSAPAVDIPGAVLPAATALRSGTSFAACFVTAAIALACCAIPGMEPRDAARRLLSRRFHRRDALPVALDADACFDPLGSPTRTDDR